jgi:hypothetical protein
MTCVVAMVFLCHVANASPALQPIVEAEETVYTYKEAGNGSGPLWCSGSTCLAHIGDAIFASGIETLPDEKPMNNCRWTLFERQNGKWQLQQADAVGRTREPCPLAVFPDGRLFLSVNPTLAPPGSPTGPSRPDLLQFGVRDTTSKGESLLPSWEGTSRFSQHSYRSLAADGAGGELILFQNVDDESHAEWTFRDRDGKWAAQGKLTWPPGTNYPNPEPIRICYPDVQIKGRAVYFFGISDIVEPYPEWRAFKKQLTGRDWDYDFRRLFYTWTPDVTREKFRPWVEIASRDKTCGWISPGDLWVGPDGAVHLVWSERAIDPRLRKKFFPNAEQSYAVNYAVVRDGTVSLRRTLFLTGEGGANEMISSAPRFQVTPDNRLFVIYYIGGTDAAGKAVSENRVQEILGNGQPGTAIRIPFKRPFFAYFTANMRGGSPPSTVVELLGQRPGEPLTMCYGRVRLW